MAKITLSPLVNSISGKVGNEVLSAWRGQAVARSRVRPVYRRSAQQAISRDGVKNCNILWKEDVPVLKTSWDKFAESTENSGYIEFLKANLADARAFTACDYFLPQSTVSPLNWISFAPIPPPGNMGIWFAPVVPAGHNLHSVFFFRSGDSGDFIVRIKFVWGPGFGGNVPIGGFISGHTYRAYSYFVEISSGIASRALFSNTSAG